MECIESRGWSILNGNIRGDEKGEFTYVGGRGSSVIDYELGNEEVWDRVLNMRVLDRVESDHLPVEVVVNEEWRSKGKGGDLESGRRRKKKGFGEGWRIWSWRRRG